MKRKKKTKQNKNKQTKKNLNSHLSMAHHMGGDGSPVGLDDLRGPFQPQCFYESD